MPLLDIFRIDLSYYQVVFFWQWLPMVWLAVILPLLIMALLAIFFLLAARHRRLFCS